MKKRVEINNKRSIFINIKKLIFIFAIIFSFSLKAEEKPAVGWQFYNLPEKKKDMEKPKQPKPENKAISLSPIEQMKLIQKRMEDARIVAIMEPTTQNIATYRVYQDFFVEKANVFSSQWQKMLLEYPDFDYNVKNSYYNATVPIKAAEERATEKRAIDALNQQYGVFFFYRGNVALDNKLAEIVKDFGEKYGLSIVPISLDGRITPQFPKSRKDSGQAAKMKIKHFPALFIVNPKKGEYKPLAYGFITQDDLARRVLNVLTDFKPRE